MVMGLKFCVEERLSGGVVRISGCVFGGDCYYFFVVVFIVIFSSGLSYMELLVFGYFCL